MRGWQHGVSITLDAVPDYWRGKPPFQSVVFRAVPDVPTRIADLRAGRADLVRGLTPDDAEALKNERDVAMLSVPTERVAYLFVNPAAGPTKDIRVRRAIALAIDRDTLISALQQGYAKPVREVLTPANFGYTDDVPAWPYDPDAARKLIAEAGAKGATVQFLTSPVYDRRLNEAVQQMLADVGLNVEIVMLDQPTYLKRRQGTPADAGGLSQGRWSCACQDADGVIYPLFRSGSIWSNTRTRITTGWSTPHAPRWMKTNGAISIGRRSKSCTTTCRVSACSRTSRFMARTPSSAGSPHRTRRCSSSR